MFERFTDAARGAVVEAQEQARVLGHTEISTEHILLGVLADADGIAARILRDLGLQHEALLRETVVLSDADADALRTIGVDLAAVRRQPEAAFGPGALDRPTLRRRGLFRRVVRVGGHLRFTDAAKRALEQSLRQALNLQHDCIDTEHVLLGLLADDQDPASQLLRRLGIDPATVRARIRDELDHAA